MASVATDRSPKIERSNGEAGPSTLIHRSSSNTVSDIVSTDTPAVKTTAACSACRHRKIKCPGEKPTCANCEKSKHSCFYPPVASRKRRYRERGASVSETGQPNSFGDDKFNLGLWPQATQMPLAFSQPNIAPADQSGMGFWSNNGSAPEWNLASQQVYQPLEAATLPIGGFTSLDALLALDPAFPSAPSEHSPVANANSGTLSAPAPSPGRVRFRVPYFRFFGPTAIAPGYKQVTSNVSRACSPTIRDLSGLMGQPRFSPAPFEEFPHLDAINHLVPVFQAHYGYMFSFIHIPRIETLDALAGITPSLLNIICALAARYSPLYGGQSPKQGMGNEPDIGGETGWEQVSSSWATKAKEQAGRSLAVSTIELVETLLLISWYEFGGDRDAGLWMYSGMAMRMAQDLGLDALGKGGVPETPGADSSQRLHCCLRIMDGVMTIGTGRLGMFQQPDWVIPIFQPLMRINGGGLPDPYGHLIRIFDFADTITRILVQGVPGSYKNAMVDIQRELSDFYANLPMELRFQASTLQAYASIYHGEAFVLLHAWFHALIILSYCPDLLIGDSVAERSSDHASVEVAASSAKSISDIISFAELIDAKAVCQPWINYPLYLAARTFLFKCSGPLNPANQTGAKAHIARAARQDFQRVMSMMRMVEKYWRGVRYIIRALEQKAEGIQQVDISDDGDGLPPNLLALLESATERPAGDAVGLSLVGTVNSPSDNQYGLIFPSWTPQA